MMYMMRTRVILTIFMALIFAISCSEDTDLIEDQREDIVTFLTTKHSPLLIAQSSVSSSLESEPEFYSTSGNTTFLYIEDYYNTDRQSRAEIKNGDTIYITFWCYDFSSFTTPDSGDLYYTNDPLYEDAFIEADLNVEYWSFEPKKIVLGQGDILKAIETALVGCRVGDSVEIYLTYNMAYGSNWVGVTSQEEPMAFFCTIDSIEN